MRPVFESCLTVRVADRQTEGQLDVRTLLAPEVLHRFVEKPAWKTSLGKSILRQLILGSSGSV